MFFVCNSKTAGMRISSLLKLIQLVELRSSADYSERFGDVERLVSSKTAINHRKCTVKAKTEYFYAMKQITNQLVSMR